MYLFELSLFGYFNTPKYIKGKYRKYHELELFQTFLHYCKSVFMISIHSNKVHFY